MHVSADLRLQSQSPGRVIGPLARTTGTAPGRSCPRILEKADPVETPLQDRVEALFSAERMAALLSEAHGDVDRALALLRREMHAATDLWQSIAFLEIALRNAVDRRMQRRHENLGREGHWIFDDARELGRSENPRHHQQPYSEISRAIERVRSNRKPITPGQIISELPFGFWHQLLSKRHRRLWPDLAGAFPNAPDRSQQSIHDRVTRIRACRNRIGHHHRLSRDAIRSCWSDVLAVSHAIDPWFGEWVGQGKGR